MSTTVHMAWRRARRLNQQRKKIYKHQVVRGESSNPFWFSGNYLVKVCWWQRSWHCRKEMMSDGFIALLIVSSFLTLSCLSCTPSWQTCLEFWSHGIPSFQREYSKRPPSWRTFLFGKVLWNSNLRKIQSALDSRKQTTAFHPSYPTSRLERRPTVGGEGGYLGKDYRRVKMEKSLESLKSIFKYSSKTRHEGSQ